ncbi:MAG: hypothetical protein JXA54_07765 [Candidatus Heimdallarchaeota archaeon]|nr:hypothetical protein [Candidatus Heimdallarchaeota archaeon]
MTKNNSGENKEIINSTEDIQIENSSLPKLESNTEINNHHIKNVETKTKTKGMFVRTLSIVFSWTAIQLFLAHHPFCETFDKHVFKIGKLRLCKGCFLSYPIAYAIPIIYIFWKDARSFLLFTPLWISNLWWFTVYIAILTFVTRYIGRQSMFVNDLSKFIRGALAGFLFVLIISEIWYLKIVAAIGLFGGMAYLSLKRGKEMQRTCDQCVYGGDFTSCPGWKDLSEIFSSVNAKSVSEKDGTQQQKSILHREDE